MKAANQNHGLELGEGLSGCGVDSPKKLFHFFPAQRRGGFQNGLGHIIGGEPTLKVGLAILPLLNP
jgi:hypothetical protein